MIMQFLPRCSRSSREICRAFLAFSSFAVISLSTFSTAAETPTATKEFTLFLGGNLEVPIGKSYYPVVRVSGDELELMVNKAPKRISLEDMHEYRIQREAKLVTVSANVEVARRNRTTISNARAELAALSQGIALQNDMIDRSNSASGAMMRASMNSSANCTGGPCSITGNNKSFEMNATMGKFSRSTAQNDLSNMNFASKRASELATADTCDALELELMISCPKPLSNAHIVLVTEFQEPGKGAETKGIISTKFLGKIDSKPLKVAFEQQGFPMGYVLGKGHYFIYENGAEIATSLSTDRRDLTRDETFRYLLVQYIANHGRETKPPTPVMGALPANFSSKADSSELNQTIIITVNKNGEITEFSGADASPAKLSPYTEKALRNFRFYPALESGMPAEGKLKLKLSDLMRKS